jgi:hypothetical protein
LKEANMLGPYPADLNKTSGQTFRRRPNHQHQSREAGSFIDIFRNELAQRELVITISRDPLDERNLIKNTNAISFVA